MVQIEHGILTFQMDHDTMTIDEFFCVFRQLRVIRNVGQVVEKVRERGGMQDFEDVNGSQFAESFVYLPARLA